jgi:hypothetical protein
VSDCGHGYTEGQRRHCVHCTYGDEITELNAENERLKSVIDYVKYYAETEYENNAENEKGEAYDDIVHQFRLVTEVIGDGGEKATQESGAKTAD